MNETKTKTKVIKISQILANNSLNELIFLNQQMFQKIKTLEKKIDEIQNNLKHEN